MAVTALSAVVATLSATVTALVNGNSFSGSSSFFSGGNSSFSSGISSFSGENSSFGNSISKSRNEYNSLQVSPRENNYDLSMDVPSDSASLDDRSSSSSRAQEQTWSKVILMNHSRKRGFSSFVLTTSYCSDQACWITSNQCCCCSWKFVALFSPHHQRMEMSIYGQWW